MVIIKIRKNTILKITDRNYGFKCHNCHKEIYGKKVKWNMKFMDKKWIEILMCLKCFTHDYNLFLDGGITGYNKFTLKKIKQKYKLDLIDLEL